MSLEVYDLTHTLEPFMPEWPSTPSLTLSVDKFHAKDGLHQSHWEGIMHRCTHMDAPLHVTENTPTIGEYPLWRLFGTGVCVSIPKGKWGMITPEDLEKASPAVRIASLGETDWKIRLTDPGVHDLKLSNGAGEITLPIFGTTRLVPIFSIFKKSSLLESIFNPGAPRIPDAMQIESIEVVYPSMAFGWGFIELSWLWSFLIISMAFGVILKFAFKVE